MRLDAEGVTANQDLPLVVTVRNSGKRAGREVVQVYLEAHDDDPHRPIRSLAAFATVEADAGQSVEARLVIPARAFARFDPDVRDWVWRPGTYTVRAGRSSRDLRLSAPAQLEERSRPG
jgi:beta-glucosidase